MDAGYWQETYWPKEYWPVGYWPVYGGGEPAPDIRISRKHKTAGSSAKTITDGFAYFALTLGVFVWQFLSRILTS